VNSEKLSFSENSTFVKWGIAVLGAFCCSLLTFLQVEKKKKKNLKKIMKMYLIQATSKKGHLYKRVIVKASNDLSGEEIYFSGFFEEFLEAKK